MNRRGFTLLEVLISVMILAFLSLFTVQAIRNAVRSKAKIVRDIDRFAEVRDALRMMERDVNMAFNYRDVNIQLYNQAQQEREKRKKDAAAKPKLDKDGKPIPRTPEEEAAAAAAAGTGEEFKPREEKILTEFRGEAHEMNFSTRSNVRMAVDEQASDQAEVGYSLKSCRSRADTKQSSQCLWRRLAPFVDDKIDQGGTETAILENVVAFDMRYLGPGKEDKWSTDWKSGEGGDDVTKKHFPYAVEVTIETQNKNDPLSKATRMTMVASIRNPNNPEKKAAEGAEGAEGATEEKPPGE